MNWIPRNLRFSPEFRAKRREEDTFNRELRAENYNRKMQMLADIHAEIFPSRNQDSIEISNEELRDLTRKTRGNRHYGKYALKWKYLATYNVAV